MRFDKAVQAVISGFKETAAHKSTYLCVGRHDKHYLLRLAATSSENDTKNIPVQSGATNGLWPNNEQRDVQVYKLEILFHKSGSEFCKL